MVALKDISLGISRYLTRELNLDYKQTDTIRYGLEIIIGAVIKGFIILSLSYWLEITSFVLAAMATSGIFRSVSGGGHCKTFLGCLIFSSATLVFIGYLANILSPFVNKESFWGFLLIIVPIGLFSVIKWAPVDHPNKPITRNNKRLRFRVLSITYIICWTTITLFLIPLGSDMPIIFTYVLASSGGFVASLLSLFPISLLFFNVFDKFLNRCF